MSTLQKSPLFLRQLRGYAQRYKDRAGADVAGRFIAAVKEALLFIRSNPYACPLFDAGEEYKDLQRYAFRKWNLHGFPHVVLFRLHEDRTIFIEVVYAHTMDIPSRLIGQ